MKLLIVDDERHVITAIRCLVPAKQLGITEIISAQTAAEAKVLLEKEKPDIAIIDIILQNQTGISLLAFIVNKRLPTQVIAISGHSDYEYVRAMLLNGAVDYLLKPVEANPLINSLQKAIARLSPGEPEKTTAPLLVNSMNLSAQYMRTLLRKLLSSPGDQSVFSKLAALVQAIPGARRCTLMYYDLAYLPSSSASFLSHVNIFEEKMKSYLAMYQCGFLLEKFTSQQNRLMLIFENGARSEKIESIAGDAFADTALSFHMGCVWDKEFPAQFPEGYAQAVAAFFSDYCEMTPEMMQPYSKPGPAPKAKHPPELERELLSQMIAQDGAGLETAAHAWLDGVLNGDATPRCFVRDLVNFYNAMYSRWLLRIREFYPDFPGNVAAERVSFCDFLDEYYTFSRPMMRAGILRSLRLLFQHMGSTFAGEDVVKQVAFYMELNYSEPLNQAEYARLFHLNKDYLSRKFKQVYGEGMITHMNRLKITHAEQLMHDPSLKIRDIAYQTGFGDEKYFTRQFKEFMQVTPSEYRALLICGESGAKGG
ncbi:MAG: helix-turn-helix domain-containing protein [Eubacteriales bacterium]|nr:helix-turn-helix domain-containing protein [Eubacteriales bacterium]